MNYILQQINKLTFSVTNPGTVHEYLFFFVHNHLLPKWVSFEIYLVSAYTWEGRFVDILGFSCPVYWMLRAYFSLNFPSTSILIGRRILQQTKKNQSSWSFNTSFLHISLYYFKSFMKFGYSKLKTTSDSILKHGVIVMLKVFIFGLGMFTYR